MMKRILICGGRDFKDRYGFGKVMDRIAEDYFERGLRDSFGNYLYDVTIISGGAKGADQYAIEWAAVQNTAYKEYPADWASYGKKAGYIRNKQMLDEGKPDLVIAFPGGRGTQMMIDLAVKAKVRVLKVQQKLTGYDVNELNEKKIEFQTPHYLQRYIATIVKLKHTTPGQKAGIMRDMLIEEEEWLKNMGKDYDEIMEAEKAMGDTSSGLVGGS